MSSRVCRLLQLWKESCFILTVGKPRNPSHGDTFLQVEEQILDEGYWNKMHCYYREQKQRHLFLTLLLGTIQTFTKCPSGWSYGKNPEENVEVQGTSHQEGAESADLRKGDGERGA